MLIFPLQRANAAALRPGLQPDQASFAALRLTIASIAALS